MKKKGTIQLIKLVVCAAATVLGIYMSFFYEKKEATPEQNPQTVIQGENETMVEKEFEENTEYLAHQETLPDYDNESSNEIYAEGTNIEVYFTNTDILDQGNLPLAAQSELTFDVQRFLNRSGYEDVTELYVDDTTYEENEKKISFNCFMDGYAEQLRIVYDIENSQLQFGISD